MLKRVIILALIILLIVTTVFIFNNSIDNEEKTYNKSDTIVEIVEPIIESLTNSKTVLENLSYFVRKAAHVFEFMLLGAESYALCVVASGKALGMFTFAPLFGTLAVGVTDEFIQSFTGRTSMVSDILIDFSGAIFGMLLVLMVFGIVQLVRSFRESKKV